MGPIEYIDKKFQEVTVRGQAGKWSAINDAQQNALQHILSVIRFLNSMIFVPYYIANFFFVNLGTARKPEPRLEQLRDMVEQEKAQAHLAKTKGKTIGFMKGGKAK